MMRRGKRIAGSGKREDRSCRCTPRFRFLFPRPSSLIPLLLLLSACGSHFDPIVENDREFFSLYGYLDERADTQFVRISPVRETAEDTSRALDARVASQNLATGEEVVWQDSLVQLDDGSTGFLYFAPMRVRHNEHYALTVRRSDGATTETRVMLPAPTTAVTDSLRRVSDEYEQVVFWNDFDKRPTNPAVAYTVVIPPNAPVTVILPITATGRSVGNSWMFNLPLNRHRNEVLIRLGRPVQNAHIGLCQIRMTVDERSPEWENQQSEVTGGFGFFGAVVQHEAIWTLTEDIRAEVGYLASDEGCQP